MRLGGGRIQRESIGLAPPQLGQHLVGWDLCPGLCGVRTAGRGSDWDRPAPPQPTPHRPHTDHTFILISLIVDVLLLL